MKPKEITKEKLINGYKYYLTVGGLKEFLEENEIPDNSKVMIQRVEDFYYEKNGWGVYLKESGNFENSVEQYHPAFCCVSYKDDEDILFINLHY